MGIAEVVVHVLGKQMPAIARGIDEHVGSAGCHGAVQHGLEYLVSRLPFVETQVIAIHDEALLPCSHQIHDIRQIDQIALVHLDETQALIGIGIQTCPNQR